MSANIKPSISPRPHPPTPSTPSPMTPRPTCTPLPPFSSAHSFFYCHLCRRVSLDPIGVTPFSCLSCGHCSHNHRGDSPSDACAELPTSPTPSDFEGPVPPTPLGCRKYIFSLRFKCWSCGELTVGYLFNPQRMGEEDIHEPDYTCHHCKYPVESSWTLRWRLVVFRPEGNGQWTGDGVRCVPEMKDYEAPGEVRRALERGCVRRVVGEVRDAVFVGST